MTSTPSVGGAELRHLVGSPTGLASWLCVIAPEEQLQTATERAVVAVQRAGALVLDVGIGPLALVQRILGLPPGVLFLFGFEKLSDDDWRHLDSLRSGLEREQLVILLLTEDSAARLSRLAPNFASWVGGAYTRWDGSAELLSPDEREARLGVLRGWFEMTNEEVIQAALEHRLPSEPQMSEWLVLLERGDLLERS